MSARDSVKVRIGTVVIPTCLPAMPDKNPMFLEKRVYQGSSGRVYPLPFTDRIAEEKTRRPWKAVWMENRFLRVLILPELGGRIHALEDKTNGYDAIYRQAVIKPALVGLAGPWVSGGIEFNWPQHHRPSTFLPADVAIESGRDGSKTVWCSEHDPMARMKGMHGVCLRPDTSRLELKVRVFNRTPLTQTFLWWANVAARVHEAYQSFFPPDVRYVADHARRAMSAYPLARGRYYGVDYGARRRHGIPAGERPARFVPPHCGGRSPVSYTPDDLSFYANIPVPTSYMCMGTREDFFGGYDHLKRAGLVHVADHRIAPGKKQWTWGNHEFGYAWDRNLTEPDDSGDCAPYIELMAGVFTDNQPDFSFLQPGETRAWSQFWYPIREIGPAHHANLRAAVSLRLARRPRGAAVRLGVSVSEIISRATVLLTARGRPVFRRRCDLNPAAPLTREIVLAGRLAETDLRVSVRNAHGAEVIAFQPQEHTAGAVPPAAEEPPPPRDLSNADELYLAGLHLEQYRHATRCPSLYWREALRRDPGDARCNHALGLWHLRRGEFPAAEVLFRKAIERLTRRNANPSDGEPFYNLGLCLRFLGRECEAADAFHKAAWNQAWVAAASHALGEWEARQGRWREAAGCLERALRFNADNSKARNLLAMVLERLGETQRARRLARESLALDRLDWWARLLCGRPAARDLQTRLDLAHDLARGGFFAEAIELLQRPWPRAGDLPDQSWGAAPLVHYTLGWLCEQLGRLADARRHRRRAAAASPDYCFPARLEEIAILEAAMRANPSDARAPYYLGNLLYDRRRHEEAIVLWERSAALDPAFSIVWRNLGIGYFNIRRQPAKARAAYEKAVAAAPEDARLRFERDQLWKRGGVSPARRLRELQRRPDLVRRRDDLSVEVCALYNQTGLHDQALELLASRRFQPWEGGEGQALGQHVRTRLALGRRALRNGDASEALRHFEQALACPVNLGEARHPLANHSDILYWLGSACAALGRKPEARGHWRAAASFRGDFQQMSVRAFSEMTCYSALCLRKLGESRRARALLKALLRHARQLEKTPARIDYFATSLPALLLFDENLQERQLTDALFLQAQARFGLGQNPEARRLLRTVLRRDPNHPMAADLLDELASEAPGPLAL